MAYIAGLALFFSQGKEWIVYGSFNVHQEEIASKWCINKNDEKSCCAGKCWLTTILQKMHDDKSPQTLIHQMEDRPSYVKPLLGFVISCPEAPSKKFTRSRDILYHYKPQFEVFHPPQLALS